MHAAAACGLYPGRGQLALQSDPLSATGDVITIVKSLDCATKLQHAVQPVVASTLATSVVPNAAWILHEADKHVAAHALCRFCGGLASLHVRSLRKHMSHILKQPIPSSFQVHVLYSVVTCQPSSYHEEFDPT